MGEATVSHIDHIALHHPMKNPIGHIDPLGLTKSLKDRQGHIALNDHMTITIVLPMKSHIVHIDQHRGLIANHIGLHIHTENPLHRIEIPNLITKNLLCIGHPPHITSQVAHIIPIVRSGAEM